MYLFKISKVKKFYNILDKLNRGIAGGLYGNMCEKQIFTQRYIKLISGLGFYAWVYDKNSRLPITLLGGDFALNWSQHEIKVYYYDFTRPTKVQEKILHHNDIISLEGIKVDNFSEEFQKMFLIPDPIKTFTFNAFKKNKKLTKTTWECEAQTIAEARELAHNYKGDLVIYDLIE